MSSRRVGAKSRVAVLLLAAVVSQFVGPLAGAANAFSRPVWIPVSQQDTDAEADAAPESQSESQPESQADDDQSTVEEPTETPSECATPVPGAPTGLIGVMVPVLVPVPDCVPDAPGLPGAPVLPEASDTPSVPTIDACALAACGPTQDATPQESGEGEEPEGSPDEAGAATEDEFTESAAAEDDCVAFADADDAVTCAQSLSDCVSQAGDPPGECGGLFVSALNAIVEFALSCVGTEPCPISELPECEDDPLCVQQTVADGKDAACAATDDLCEASDEELRCVGDAPDCHQDRAHDLACSGIGVPCEWVEDCQGDSPGDACVTRQVSDCSGGAAAAPGTDQCPSEVREGWASNQDKACAPGSTWAGDCEPDANAISATGCALVSGNWTQCVDDTKALRACADAPAAQSCENAAFVAASNALCGVANDEGCVPAPVVSLRTCVGWDEGNPQLTRQCAATAVIDAACGSLASCPLRHPALTALVACGLEDTACAAAVKGCADAPQGAPCAQGLRGVVVGALCAVDPSVCVQTLNDKIDACKDDNRCIAKEVMREACVRVSAACPAEVQELEPCVSGTQVCNEVFLRKWVGRACAKSTGWNNALCTRNPVVDLIGATQTLPDGTVVQVPFENGSSTFPFRSLQVALDALRGGGTNTSWALASPVKLNPGMYPTPTIQAESQDEEPKLVLLAPSGGVTINASTSRLVLPPSRTVALGAGIKVTGLPQAIQGPTGAATLTVTEQRVNAGQAVHVSVTTSLSGVSAPEPLDSRFVVRSAAHLAAGDISVEQLMDDGSWAPLTAQAAGQDLIFGIGSSVASGTTTALPVVTYQTGPPFAADRTLRVSSKAGPSLVVSAEVVGRHSTVVYATATAAPVHVVVGQPYDWPTSAPRPRPTPTATEAPGPLPVGDEGDRLSGEDRSSTAAAVSRSSFSGGADTVYIATGAAYADALAAGPAAVRNGGPVLLVERDRLPDATRTEVQRLRPRRIVLLGGTQAIGAAVEEELARMANGLDRIKGSDRYATAAAVSAAHFAADVPVVYVSSGEGFADALSGGAAAATQRGPVLLVRPDSIPSSSAEELRRLGPARIVVLGGTKAVSEAVATQLRAYTTGGVHRVSGSTRYATSAAVSRYAFASRVSTVYIATGESFPDALAGVPAAGAAGSPLLLVQPDRLPQEVAGELDRLRPGRIVILGGERSVSLRLERELRSYETAP